MKIGLDEIATQSLLDRPVFIISLDVELLWGMIHENAKSAKSCINLLISDPQNGRGAIAFLLSVFEKYSIPATWAIVGHLFLDSCEGKEGVAHKDMPRPKEDWYSVDPCTDIHSDPLYYGSDIIEKVLSSPIGHDIGYHSFSHPTFTECRREVAQAEVETGVKLAQGFGIILKSFIFPQNQVAHVDILKENGFQIYRGATQRHWDSTQSFPKRKLSGGIDKIIASPVVPLWEDGIWQIPGSMLFYDPQIPSSLLPRARFGMERAIWENKVLHIFLHPHNLLAQPSLGKILDNFLSTVAKKRDEGKLQVMTMAGLANRLNERIGYLKEAN